MHQKQPQRIKNAKNFRGGWGACPGGHALRASGPPPFYFPGSAPVKDAVIGSPPHGILHRSLTNQIAIHLLVM